MQELTQTTPRKAAPVVQTAPANLGEMLYPVPDAVRAGLRLDLRYVLRDAVRARTLPLLCALNQTIDRELARIRFPVEALARLAGEIDSVADGLPEHSPLLDLSERARAFARAAAYDKAAQTVAGAASARAPQAPATSAIDDALPRSVSEEAQQLRRAAAAIEVAFVTTTELDDRSLAGYLNYCMTLENYEAVIASLLPRTIKGPKVWIWNLLLAAMRLSKHSEFTATGARFHAWIEARHPEAISESIERVDARRFSTQKLRILEQQELGIA